MCLGSFYCFLQDQIWPSTLTAGGSAERVKNLVRKLELREDAMEDPCVPFLDSSMCFLISVASPHSSSCPAFLLLSTEQSCPWATVNPWLACHGDRDREAEWEAEPGESTSGRSALLDAQLHTDGTEAPVLSGGPGLVA